MARIDKVAEALKKEVSLIIHDELKDPRLGFITVTGVEVTKDLREAKIFFSVLGKDEERQSTKEALDSALGFIRKLIAERIRLRFVPEITFKEDRSSEYGARIEEILNEIKQVEIKPERKFKREPKKSRRANKKK